MNSKFELTPEQIAQLKQLLTTVVVSLVIGLLSIFTGYEFVIKPQLAQLQQGGVAVTPTVAPSSQSNPFAQPTSAPFNVDDNPIRIKQVGVDAITVWNGSRMKFYSDGGSTLKFSIDGATGDLTAHTITATTIVSQAVGFDTTGNGTVSAPSITFASDPNTGIYRVGADNIGVAVGGSKVFDCTTAGCTTTGLITGTLGTAAQPNITSLGTIAALNATTMTVSGVSRFDNAMTVNANGDFDSISVAGDSDVTTIKNTGVNPVTINDDLVITGTTTFQGSNIHASESITPTDGADITITASIVTLTPAGATGNSLAACTTGKSALLYNSVNANVVITDTGNAILAGNQTLGQYDTLPLVCIDSKWVQAGPVSSN